MYAATNFIRRQLTYTAASHGIAFLVQTVSLKNGKIVYFWKLTCYWLLHESITVRYYVYFAEKSSHTTEDSTTVVTVVNSLKESLVW